MVFVLHVGLLPAGQKPMRGVSLMPVRDPDVTLRAYVAVRRGREDWPPLALIARELGAIEAGPQPAPAAARPS